MEKFWNRGVSFRLIGVIATLAGIIVSANSQLKLHAPFATPASTFLIHQTHPWGFSYSFTEHGRNGINSNSIVQKNPFVVPLGFSFPQLPLVPLPILRNNNATDSSSNSSTVTTTTAAPSIETTSISSSTEQATSTLPTVSTFKPELRDANTAFFLSSPLSFSYGFTAFDNSPLPIPQIPFLGLQPNAEPPKVETDKAVSNDITEQPTEKATETVSSTTTTAKPEQESTTSSSPESETVSSAPVEEITTVSTTTTTTESAVESDSTTLSSPPENFETETIAPTNADSKVSDSKSLDKLESEVVDSADVATNTPEATPEATTTPQLPANEVVESSSTLATVEIAQANTNTVLLINGDKSEFSYSIKDETTFDEKSHEEQRNGDSVKGKYSVVEPDGSLRTVTYTADGDGFKADVVRKESYTKPFPVWKSNVAAAPGTISSTLSDQNVVSYYYNRFHSPPPMPQVARNFGYGYYIVPNNWG